MTKEIRFAVTPAKAQNLGIECHSDRGVLVPFDLDLDEMSPAARWVAEHITSTYVLDEHRDVCDIYAIAGFSMEERDRARGKPDADIDWGFKIMGDDYTKPMSVNVVFDFFGMTNSCPEDVLKKTIERYRGMGSVRLLDLRSGDTFDLEDKIRSNQNGAKQKVAELEKTRAEKKKERGEAR